MNNRLNIYFNTILSKFCTDWQVKIHLILLHKISVVTCCYTWNPELALFLFGKIPNKSLSHEYSYFAKCKTGLNVMNMCCVQQGTCLLHEQWEATSKILTSANRCPLSWAHRWWTPLNTVYVRARVCTFLYHHKLNEWDRIWLSACEKKNPAYINI